MTDQFELATGDKADVTQTIELFMATCKRCGRCYEHETTNAIDRMSMKGYRYDNLEVRAVIPVSTEHLDSVLLEKTEKYKRPEKVGE
jgi:hydrogenase-4 component H